MSDLVDFLLARIAEDEAVARAANVDRWGYEVGSPEGYPWQSLVLSSDRDATEAQDDFIARHDPARVLAECEAKRRTVAQYIGSTGALSAQTNPVKRMAGELIVVTLRDVLKTLALPYANHPDFDPEWAV